MTYYDNGLDELTNPYQYLTRIIDSYLPEELKGVIKKIEVRLDACSGMNLVYMMVVFPGGVSTVVGVQLSCITDIIADPEYVARKIEDKYRELAG